jgi:hypothetical protein
LNIIFILYRLIHKVSHLFLSSYNYWFQFLIYSFLSSCWSSSTRLNHPVLCHLIDLFPSVCNSNALFPTSFLSGLSDGLTIVIIYLSILLKTLNSSFSINSVPSWFSFNASKKYYTPTYLYYCYYNYFSFTCLHFVLNMLVPTSLWSKSLLRCILKMLTPDQKKTCQGITTLIFSFKINDLILCISRQNCKL